MKNKKLILALGCMGLALATQAAGVTFDFQENGSNKALGTPSTFTEGGLSITASGFDTSGTASGLFAKMTSGDPTETGLGMTNDVPDHEINSSHFIQLDFSDVSPASSVTITISSIQGGPPDETAVVYATQTPGSLVGAIKIATLDGSGGTVQTVDPTIVTPLINAGYFIDVTASAGNVLIETVSVQGAVPANPRISSTISTVRKSSSRTRQAGVMSGFSAMARSPGCPPTPRPCSTFSLRRSPYRLRVPVLSS